MSYKLEDLQALQKFVNETAGFPQTPAHFVALAVRAVNALEAIATALTKDVTASAFTTPVVNLNYEETVKVLKHLQAQASQDLAEVPPVETTEAKQPDTDA